MKLNVTPATSVPASRIARRIRDEVLSSRTVQRFRSELADELAAISSEERSTDAELRRDALERAVRRVWGATL